MRRTDEEEDELEISDLILSYDPVTLDRRAVRKSDVLAYFEQRGNRAAFRVMQKMPERDGILDEAAVDDVLLRCHIELQRLEEEFLHAHRVLDLIRAVVRAFELQNVPRPWRIVDVGCGLGYVTRWLTSFGGLGPDVQLLGVDFNHTLIDAAQHLAHQEGLRCQFRVQNAFTLEEPATLYISSGVLHHFRNAELVQFFASQVEALAFIHIDIRPSPLTPLGSWLYHRARMRQPLARHDGVVSARRAHPADELLQAARAGAPGFDSRMFGDGPLPFLEVFQSIVSIRPDLSSALEQATEELGLGANP